MNKSKGYGKRGWVFIISMLLVYFASISMINSVNIMAPVLSATKGWDAALITSSYTIAGLIAVVFQLILGGILMKKSSKTATIVADIVFIVATLVFGFVTSLWQFIAVMIVIKIAQTAIAMSTAYMTANWFPTKKGSVMGITTFGAPLAAGFGMIIMGALVGKSMFAAYLPFAVIALIALLLHKFALSEHPEQLGCYPDNNANMSKEDLAAALAQELEWKRTCPWTVKRVLASKDAWFLMLPIAFLLLGSVGFMTQITSVLMSVDAAFYDQFGGLVLAGISIVACIGSYICGVIDDKFGTKIAVFIANILMALAALLSMSGSLVLTLIGLAFLAVFMGGGSNFMVSGVAQYWKRSGFGNVYRILLPIGDIIGALGPALVAYIAVASGGYSGSFLFMLVLGIIGAVMVMFVNGKRVSAQEEKFKQMDAVKK